MSWQNGCLITPLKGSIRNKRSSRCRWMSKGPLWDCFLRDVKHFALHLLYVSVSSINKVLIDSIDGICITRWWTTKMKLKISYCILQ